MRAVVLKKKFAKDKHRFFSFVIASAPLAFTFFFMRDEVNIGYALTIIAVFIAAFIDDAAHKLKLESEQHATLYWGTFGLKFNKIHIHKRSVRTLKIDQLTNRHFALILELTGGQDLVLIENPTKTKFKEQLKEFSKKISGAPFFENLGLINEIDEEGEQPNSSVKKEIEV